MDCLEFQWKCLLAQVGFPLWLYHSQDVQAEEPLDIYIYIPGMFEMFCIKSGMFLDA